MSILLYVEDVDAVVRQAVAAGAKIQRPIEDKFYGDRMGSVDDPFGHVWHIATHTKDVSPEEMKKAGRGIGAEVTPSRRSGIRHLRPLDMRPRPQRVFSALWSSVKISST